MFIVIFFGVVYSLISLVNHYNFRTYALDLGAYTNALYDYSHFQRNDSSIFKVVPENLLADHFDLYLIIFSPLSYIFGTYTLLIIQILSVLAGGIGVYAFLKISNKSNVIAIFASLHFFSFFAIYSAISNDYHSNVIAASLIPWLFFLIKKRKILKSSLLLLLILISKENISLWLVFICIGLSIEFRKDHYLRNYLIIASVFSGIYFVLITTVVMPAFSNAGSYPHFQYSYLGKNYSEAIMHLINHPIESIKVLFINHNNTPGGNSVKTELHLLLLFSGLPLLLKKPQYLLMLVPIYFQKLFHDNYTMWSISAQYCIEFAPILSIGIFMVIAEFKRKLFTIGLSIIVLFFTLASTKKIMNDTIFPTDEPRIRFYERMHYQKDYDVINVHRQLSIIPEDAIVSAQSAFVPHLSLRENIYQFPIIKNADYIIYTRKESSYPLTPEEFNSKINDLEQSKDWEILYNGSITILRKVSL